jgi:anaerobic dimethyl sulfoxide reductase subunit B (iron-sulfur subunit)
MTQYGFFFDQSRCTGCRDCTVACKNWHQLPPGPLKYLKVYEYEKGSFPQVRIHFQWVPCYHCEKPECVDACPVEAISKETKYGAVLLDSEKCTGCRNCYEECPYGAPVFADDNIGTPAQKCDMCIDRLEAGELPICVGACSARALDFGPLSEMQARYGNSRDLEDLPNSGETMPSVVFKPHAARKPQIVPYDAQKALELMAKRDPLPPLYNKTSDVTNIPDGMVGRSGLIIKHKTAAELMRDTRCDEG